jgi:hypothetical protein
MNLIGIVLGTGASATLLIEGEKGYKIADIGRDRKGRVTFKPWSGLPTFRDAKSFILYARGLLPELKILEEKTESLARFIGRLRWVAA